MRSRFYGSLIFMFPPQRETAETTAPVIVNELFRMGLSSTDVPPFYGFLRGGNVRISRTESRDHNCEFIPHSTFHIPHYIICFNSAMMPRCSG